MKKYGVGLALIALAIAILFQDAVLNIPLPLPLWVMIIVAGLAISTVSGFLNGHLTSPFVTGTILFILLNHYYHFVTVGGGTVAFAAFLALLGLKAIRSPKKSKFSFNKTSKDVLFSGETRYINDENFLRGSIDVAFGSAKVYFENAQILGDVATFDVDAAFADVKLYVPQNWRVDLQVDNAFSMATNHPSDFPTDKTLRVTADLAFSNLLIYYV